jgi:hypothetical protein
MSSSIRRSPAAYLAPLLAAAAITVASSAPAASATDPNPPSNQGQAPKKNCRVHTNAPVRHGEVVSEGRGIYKQCNDGKMERVYNA